LTSSIESVAREVGERLRLAREQAGLSPRDLANRTRISLRHIEALEQGDFAPLNGFIFVRGFVGSICRELKADPGPLLALLKTIEPGDDLPVVPLQATQAIRPRPGRSEGRGQSGSSRPAPVSPALLLVIFYLLVASGLVVLVLLMTGVIGGGSANAPVPAPVADVVERPVQAQDAPLPAASPAPVSAPARPSAATTVRRPLSAATRAGELRLRIVATDRTWLKVQADDQPSQEMTLKKDGEASFVARDHFLLSLGNAGGVFFELNGRPIGPAGAPGQVVTNYILNRDNL
jgi:cytoskeleton protein RodZ